MVQVTDKIRVRITYSISFCDLPKTVHDLVHKMCCDWGYGTNEQLPFDSILDYYDDDAESRKIIKDFMKENDLNDDYCVDLDW